MKKIVSMIYVSIGISLLTVPAMADAIVPSPAEMALGMAGPVFALSVAIIAVVVLIRTIIQKFKKK